MNIDNTQHEIICKQQGEIAQLTKERDEVLRKDELKTKEHNLLVLENRKLKGKLDTANALRAHAENALEAAQAKCAEMREALELALGVGYDECGWQQKAQHALSTDCGRGYVPVSELEKTIELLREFVSSLQHFFGRNCSSSQKAETELARLQALKEGK